MDYRDDFTYEQDVTTAERQLEPISDLMHYLRQFARERPEVMALTCFGIGFILGWKLKPW